MASLSPASRSSAPQSEACIVCLPSAVVRYDLDISLLYDFWPSTTRYNVSRDANAGPGCGLRLSSGCAWGSRVDFSADSPENSTRLTGAGEQSRREWPV